MNYKEEINKLNINIKQIITQHSNNLQTGVAKSTLSKYSNEDPFSDQLISNSVQQMVTYFMNKYSLISEEAEEIKNLIPKGNIEDNNKDKEYLKIFKQEEQKINSNLLNLTKAKNRYYALMTKLEDQISKIEENKKKVTSNDLLKIFSTNFFYEYLHYYFSYQLLNQAYIKIKSDNESINNIKNKLI